MGVLVCARVFFSEGQLSCLSISFILIADGYVRVFFFGADLLPRGPRIADENPGFTRERERERGRRYINVLV